MEKAVLKRMELAKTGSFGADGAAITLANLQDVIDTFDGKCPVSLGHYMTKQDWWPSWGNVETVQLVKDPDGVNGILYGDVSFNSLIAEAIDSGFYPGWSVSIPARAADGKRYLHHLAMLGSIPPKIRDMQVIAQVGGTKPDNAIDTKGEGMQFADQAFYSFSDFPKTPTTSEPPKDQSVEEPTAAAILPEVPQPAVPPEPKKPDGTEFSDQLAQREARARSVYKEGVKARLISEIGERWPAGRRDQVVEFTDMLVDIHDYDFADSGDKKEKSLVDLFVELIKGMTATAQPKPGRSMEFSDPGRQPETVDRANLAQRF
jgi:hypothetical protein